MSQKDHELLRHAQSLAVGLIVNGHVDSNNETYDGVRALYQLLHGLPVTGYSCKSIKELEQRTRDTVK